MNHFRLLTTACIALASAFCVNAQTPAMDTPTERDARMAWWRDARFGMFIHWGLYAVPAGAWNGRTNYGEWIRHSGQIPLEEYNKYQGQFNPVQFSADEWVRMAKDAGMKYIVITSKHHDGFCLWDSKETDWDVGNTPFRRDILKELSDACDRAGLKFCTYHSIMDWHQPDYLPRRDWEQNTRSAEGANFDRYVQYMKNQLREIVTGYKPAILWFDGEWENTWTHERGVDLYHFVRGLKPDIIINNRVDVMRDGMAGFSRDSRAVGDYDTPEQEIPASAVTGRDWETCMTMNDNWGYNAKDANFKSTEDLIRKLIDIAAKNGNFLLNVGPKADGTFPQESIDRLRDIGKWMKVNGESIYGTKAGPFKELTWGRCTQKPIDGGATRLYLHVFDWPTNGKLRLVGLLNEPRSAHVLTTGEKRPLDVTRDGDALVIAIPPRPVDAHATVIALDIAGKADVGEPPDIRSEATIFVDTLTVTFASSQENVQIRYTLDASIPDAKSPLVSGPLTLSDTTTVGARAFRGDKPVSGARLLTLSRVAPRPAAQITSDGQTPGLAFDYYEGEWDKLPAFDTLKPAKSGNVADFVFDPRARGEAFAFRYRGYLRVPARGVWTLYTTSDDGSRLYIGDKLVVDNDGLHGMSEKSGLLALEAGYHPITVTYFERSGGDALEVHWSGPGTPKQRVPQSALLCAP